jgi:hypothetical protein
VRSEKEVRRRLESLKGRVGEENSFAFMFACCGRGEDHYRGQQFIHGVKLSCGQREPGALTVLLENYHVVRVGVRQK